MNNNRISLALTLALASAGAAAASTAHICVNASGETVIQDTVCAADAVSRWNVSIKPSNSTAGADAYQRNLDFIERERSRRAAAKARSRVDAATTSTPTFGDRMLDRKLRMEADQIRDEQRRYPYRRSYGIGDSLELLEIRRQRGNLSGARR